MATVIADAVVGFHLRRCAAGHFLRIAGAESEILHLHFWDAAFEKLKASGRFSWRRRAERGLLGDALGNEVKEVKEIADAKDSLASAASTYAEEDQSKIIVRSNGTVTYVGKILLTSFGNSGCLGRIFTIAGG